jgi:hypothetical protein
MNYGIERRDRVDRENCHRQDQLHQSWEKKGSITGHHFVCAVSDFGHMLIGGAAAMGRPSSARAALERLERFGLVRVRDCRCRGKYLAVPTWSWRQPKQEELHLSNGHGVGYLRSLGDRRESGAEWALVDHIGRVGRKGLIDQRPAVRAREAGRISRFPCGHRHAPWAQTLPDTAQMAIVPE